MEGHGERERFCRLDLTMIEGPSTEEIDAVSERYPYDDEMPQELMDALDELDRPRQSGSYCVFLSPYQALAVRQLLEELGVKLHPTALS